MTRAMAVFMRNAETASGVAEREQVVGALGTGLSKLATNDLGERTLASYAVAGATFLIRSEKENYAVHTMLAKSAQPFDKADYATFIAESASIGNEMLLSDYVIAHELVHLREAHHGPDFWAALGRAMPDWQKRKDVLVTRAKDYLVFGLSTSK